MIRHLAAITWDLAIYGPHGGPATNRHHTYRWLTSTHEGRAALGAVWLGMHLVTHGTLALLALRVRQAEFAEVTR